MDKNWLLGTRLPAEFSPQLPDFAVGMAYVIEALAAREVWPTFEIRLTLGGSVEERSSEIQYLHLEGSFATEERPIDVRLANPETISARLSATDAVRFLQQWARGLPVVVGERSLRLPAERYGSLQPQHGRLDGQGQTRLVGEAYPDSDSQIMGWQMYAYAIQTPSVEDTIFHNEFRNVAVRAGSHPGEFSLHHLGRDITRLNGLGLDLVFPLPMLMDASVDDEDLLVALHLRGPLTHRVFWVSNSIGPWDLALTRHRSWTVGAANEHGWVKGTVRLPGAAVAPMVSVWAGRREEPDMMVRIPVRARRALVEQADALRLVYSSTSLADSLQPGPEARGNVAQQFEVAVANVLGALGYACINAGVPVKAEGIDVIAFHEVRGETLIVSATTATSLSRKVAGLVGRRSLIAQALKGWTCKLLLVTPRAHGDIPPGDLRDCGEAGVAVLTGSELQHAATDIEILREALRQLLAGIPGVTLG